VIILTNFDECCALYTLDRPGPIEAGVMLKFLNRSNSEEDFSLGCKYFDEPLKETYGIPVYRDQIVEIIKNITEVDYSEAEMIRRNIIKRMSKETQEAREQFVNSVKLKDLELTLREKLWDIIQSSAPYCLHKNYALGIVPAVPSHWLLFKYDMMWRYGRTYE